MKQVTTVIIFASILVFTACQIDGSSLTESASEPESRGVLVPTATAQPEPEQDSTDSGSGSESPVVLVPTVTATAAASTPIENQHPAEQLISTFIPVTESNGDLLVLYGQVLDVNGNPVSNTVVEIWQTDASGVYDHPGDPGTDNRDTTFQFYGMATVNANGWYAFRTIVPGRYEPRPRHIHYKVKQDNSTLLTSQFYFSDDIAEVQGEGIFRAVGNSGDLLLLQLVQGEGVLLANGQIVVDTGIGAGTLPLTPRQAEGPYYPVVDLLTYDNDLAQLP